MSAVAAASALFLLSLPVGRAAAAPADPVPAAAGLERVAPVVTGYALGGLAPRRLAAEAHALRTVTIDGVTLTRDGADVGAPSAPMRRLAARAHREGLRTELLLSNYSNRLGDFDARAAHRLLSDPARVSHVARVVARHARDGGWDGVNVDLELVPERDAGGLVSLVAALQEHLPGAAAVSVDVSASTSLAGYRRGGYALGRLGRHADLVQLMTYDQHGPTWSGPGPVGDLRWQRRAARTLLTAVPAAKVDLGVAGYGYTWPRRGTGHTVSPRRARELAGRDGVRPVWHRASGEWSARLDDGTVVWWSDARSYRRRVALARDLGVHGLAVWRLGSADPL